MVGQENKRIPMIAGGLGAFVGVALAGICGAMVGGLVMARW